MVVNMNIGIVGLGLIGGSLAKTLKENQENRVFGLDLNESALLEADMFGAVDGRLDEESIKICDVLLIAVYPKAVINYVTENAERIKPGAFVIDCAGVKRGVCEKLFPIAGRNGFTFVGGHPMAGTQYSGFKYSRGTLFKNAPMVLCAEKSMDIAEREKLKAFFLGIGFGSVIFTTPEKHDEMIAFTSQLAHVVSNAYVKSPAAAGHKGFSAGSYKDLTRVARLNENMWSELFLANRENLLHEIDVLTENLAQYRLAIAENDRERLTALLREGREHKERAERG